MILGEQGVRAKIKSSSVLVLIEILQVFQWIREISLYILAAGLLRLKKMSVLFILTLRAEHCPAQYSAVRTFYGVCRMEETNKQRDHWQTWCYFVLPCKVVAVKSSLSPHRDKAYDSVCKVKKSKNARELWISGCWGDLPLPLPCASSLSCCHLGPWPYAMCTGGGALWMRH